MIYGKQDILAYFRKQSKKYFAIYKRKEESAGSPMFTNSKSDDEQGVDAESALRDFEEVLSWLQSGDYLLMLNDRPKVSERGGNRIEFRVTLEESLGNKIRDIQTAPVAGIGGTYSMEDVMSKAKIMALEEFEKLQVKKEAEDLKKKVDDLEKDLKEARQAVDDPINRFIGALSPHAPALVAGIMGTPTIPIKAAAAPFVGNAISGTRPSTATPDLVVEDNSTEDQLAEHAQQVFENFAEALEAARPSDWLVIMQKLTNVIKNNPQKFEMALNFL